MSSDYEYSDEDGDYYDDELMDEDDQDSAPSEEEMDIDAFDGPIKEKRKAYQVDFITLSKQDVEKAMDENIEYITGLFGIEPEAASLLLRHFEWNKEKVTEKYIDNQSGVNAAAGVSAKTTPPRSATSGPSRSTRRTAPASSRSKKSLSVEGPFVCPICFDDTQTRTLALACSHKFCTECWMAYATNKIKSEGEFKITCMAEECNLVATDSFIQSILTTDPSTFDRYKELLVRYFVSCNRELKFCPYPECAQTVSCPAAASKFALTTIIPIVNCEEQKHKFCFACPIEDDHRPLICTVSKLWSQKCRDDSETANWIKSNTKECSKCQSTIEKDGGCNHMTCKKCKYEFCWVCMGPWSEHGTAWYSCNRYDEKDSIDARDAQSKSRASLERYLHYYNRWANHEQSAKLSMDLYAKTEKKMEEMQLTSALTWIEVQFMRKAVDEVFRCRMTLKWTYAMAYYLQKGNQKEIFEDNQRDLEKAVEDLSELLEQPIDAETIGLLRQKVTDKTVYVQKRNEKVLEDSAAGYLEGRWKWNVTVEGFD
ncbi:RING-5 domain-containing protein [Thelephora terrestris]|uniref:RBR-type E3 ubiquitin transferase n=1 Tax=Thelephora terrestris TaxID=56493 RepID=A0A9P6LCI1_9AGAM|nr:RING-5 domain-containing protein [Thelephora terrestris]